MRVSPQQYRKQFEKEKCNPRKHNMTYCSDYSEHPERCHNTCEYAIEQNKLLENANETRSYKL